MMYWNNEELQKPSENQTNIYLVLVNKQKKIPGNWEEKIELVETRNAFNKIIKIEKETLEMFNKLREDLLNENIDIQLENAYRSISKQEELYNEMEEKYWPEYAKKYVAPTGYSEHHTWFALDICINKNWKIICENHDMIVECEIFEKVHKKLANYWFILRYPEWKEDITGYEYEAWHLRYIWDTNIAKEITENWITLEEYWDKLNK